MLKKINEKLTQQETEVDVHFFPQVWGVLSFSCFKYTFRPFLFLFFLIPIMRILVFFFFRCVS